MSTTKESQSTAIISKAVIDNTEGIRHLFNFIRRLEDKVETLEKKVDELEKVKKTKPKVYSRRWWCS